MRNPADIFFCNISVNPIEKTLTYGIIPFGIILKEVHMNKESLKAVNDINRAIIKARGIYSEWSARHGISYHEMLVLYTIREFGFCTQKQICDSYLLPRQTMNNVITLSLIHI